MTMPGIRRGALVIVGSIVLVPLSLNAQQRRTPVRIQAARTPDAIQQRYGVQGAYDGTTLHPEGRRSAAVPVTMQDGRTGEFVIPTDPRQDPHSAYFRDDQTGNLHPVRLDPRVSRQQFVQNPRAVRYQPEPRHANKQSWESDALVVGGGAAGGALIGAAAGGANGAGMGAVAGGVAGLIYDIVKNRR
jgi:hypothetical protein